MKLLNKSIRAYLVYSIIALVFSIPLFYFVIQHIVYEEVDEGLVAQKNQLVQQIKNGSEQSTALGIELFPSSLRLARDSFYNISVYDKISGEHIPYRVIAGNVRIGTNDYTLQLKRSLIDNEDLIQSIVLVMSILLLFIVAGFLLINRIISKKLWRPFYHTVNTLNDYELERNEMPVFENTNTEEFRDLNKSIRVLIEKNLLVYQSQKEFTENAAHEMQTPLAILQGKLELLMQTHPINEEQALLISDLSAASQRVNRLTRNLLLLTKIENKQFIDKEDISLQEVIGKLREQFSFAGEQKQITIQHDSPIDMTISANRTLLEVLVGNLLTNAIRHSPNGGAVCIQLDPLRGLTISNSAKDGPLDPDRIFQRFQKISTDHNSIGLGLAIAGKICALYHFKLGYQFANNQHIFSVKFHE